MSVSGLERLLRPRSVAVIGASADATKTSGRPIAYLLKHGFIGAIYPVNPRTDRIAGLASYRDVASLPEAPDVGIVLLGAERAHDAVRELAQRGAAAAIVVASGYAEVGEEGVRRQRQLVEAAGSMRLLGPNTIGLVNLTDEITLSASSALEIESFRAGSIGVVSQSGGILGSLLSRAEARGVGLSKLISTSNEADLEIADFVDHLAGDDATSVIALYMEGLRNPARFRAAAMRAAEAGKPVVVFKIGRSASGAQAAVSHTGALAGADRMYDALFREVGAIRAHAFSDLLDIPAALATKRRLRGKRVAILTSTGGAGTLVADSLGVAGFDTPAPDPATAADLRALQSGDHAVLDRNPIDVTLAGLQPDMLRGVVTTLLASPSYEALAVIVGSSALAMPELMAGVLRGCLGLSDKPIVAYVSPHAPEVMRALNRSGIPAFAAPEACAAVFAAMHASAQDRPAPAAVDAGYDRVSIDDIGIGALDEAQAKALFARFGIAVTRERVVANVAEAEKAARELGGKVVLKILSAAITHKSDVGGVAVGVAAEQIGARLEKMVAEVKAKSGVAPTRFLVQELVTDGLEMILGFHRDPLGSAVLLGLGGATAELFNDTTMRMLPGRGGLSAEEALSMLRELRSWPLLGEFRGRPASDVDALVAAIVAFSRMVAALGARVEEAEINPIFVLPRGRGVRAADGVCVLKIASTADPTARAG
jgi:acyl-CoA synthetase (NDP forming)